MQSCLAIDIGASSGRHVLFWLDHGKIKLEEVHRFVNQMEEKDGHFYWNIDELERQVVLGIKKSLEHDFPPKTLAIDTWAVDYTLLDKDFQRLSEVYAYRDHRTQSWIDDQDERLFKNLYQKSGIAFQPFNSLYQLMSEPSQKIQEAKVFLMVPDYLNFCLTGKLSNELTNMSTTQLLATKQSNLKRSIINSPLTSHCFPKIYVAGETLGEIIHPSLVEAHEIEVMICASHDTASAFMASADGEGILLSSGTWSLMGVILDEPIITKDSYDLNFTNERHYNNQYRMLKNIMGLWIIQEVQRLYPVFYSFSQLVDKARVSTYEYVFDANDSRYLNPHHMIEEIYADLNSRQLPLPQSIEDLSFCVFNSLAETYRVTVEQLERLTQKTYKTINVMGGGCQNSLLNELIAKKTHKQVIVGPVEATAIGNAMAQWIGKDDKKDMQEIRELVRDSFEITEYER